MGLLSTIPGFLLYQLTLLKNKRKSKKKNKQTQKKKKKKKKKKKQKKKNTKKKKNNKQNQEYQAMGRYAPCFYTEIAALTVTFSH
jgi:mannitol-specific phosphotransferase system IIBC component